MDIPAIHAQESPKYLLEIDLRQEARFKRLRDTFQMSLGESIFDLVTYLLKFENAHPDS